MEDLRTTDLNLLRLGDPFTWGTLVKIHDIGRYSFVEYKAYEFIESQSTGKFEEQSSFSVYVDGEATSSSCKSLEHALLYAIAYGKLEVNAARWMAMAAVKLMELP